MIFTLTELEHHPIHFEVTYAPGEVPLPDELRQRGGLEAKGMTELLRNTQGEIRMRGHMRVEVETDCDRCLEPASIPLDSDFDLFYRPVTRTETHGEIHLEEGEIDISFYEGDSVALREVLREFILLSVPMQNVCREECKGLCPECGGNRNEQECGCRTEKEEERWTALKGLKL